MAMSDHHYAAIHRANNALMVIQLTFESRSPNTSPWDNGMDISLIGEIGAYLHSQAILREINLEDELAASSNLKFLQLELAQLSVRLTHDSFLSACFFGSLMDDIHCRYPISHLHTWGQVVSALVPIRNILRKCEANPHAEEVLSQFFNITQTQELQRQ